MSKIERGWSWRNLIPKNVAIDQGMNDLVELNLSYIAQVQCIIDITHIYSRVQNVFSKLVVVELEGMKNLEELCNGPLPFDSLKSLERLEIKFFKQLQRLFKCKLNLYNLRRVRVLRHCPMLDTLLQLSTSRSLVLLEESEIAYCERLKHIITDERRGVESRGEIIDGDNYDNKSCGQCFQN